MSKTAIEAAIACMDDQYQISPDDFLDGIELVSESEELIDNFRDKWNIKKDIGNASVWSNSDIYDEARSDYEKLRREIFEICWEHMKELMLNCGAGDIANEVLRSELFGTPPSWEKEKATT